MREMEAKRDKKKTAEFWREKGNTKMRKDKEKETERERNGRRRDRIERLKKRRHSDVCETCEKRYQRGKRKEISS